MYTFQPELYQSKHLALYIYIRFANDILYFSIVNLYISVYNAPMDFLNFELKI